MTDRVHRMKRNNRRTVVVLLAIVAGLFGLYVQAIKSSQKIDLTKLNATVLNNPRQISDFKLTDNTGQTFTQDSLRGHWTMMFFGFTRCPSICPTTMAELSKTYKQFAKDNVKDFPQVVMVSIDPERDTPES